MPINPNALSTPDPDPTPPPTQEELKDVAQHVAETQQRDDQEQTIVKRTRRSKAQMIAEAVVPADDALIEVKDAGTGAKVQRPWLEAVQLVKDGKAEFVDKMLKHAVSKMEQQQVADSGAFTPSEDPAAREVRYTINGEALLKTGEATSLGGDVVVNWVDPSGTGGSMTDAEWALLSTSPPVGAVSNVPPDAELGDEVRVGSETLRVGHGGVLTSSPVAVDGEVVKPKRRWQRALGAGLNGPWESTILRTDDKPPVDVDPAELSKAVAFDQKAAQNGHGDGPVVETERLPAEIERVSLLTWKVGTGILDKIGLPDYSSLQIGPISASRMVVDDGRRSEVTIGDRKASVPTSVLEAYREIMDVTEYIARHQRGELVSFLESTGALVQPVS
jgi:hypothetical protein